MTEPTRSDPIGDRYYKPVEHADRVSLVLFWISGLLSLVIAVIDKAVQPQLYDACQIAFVLSVAVLFIVNLLIKLEWFPRAEDRRREEFISNALGVPLIHERTQGYYNTDEADPVRRLGVSLMENCFFTKSIAGAMLVRERAAVVLYTVAFVLAMLNRSTDLGVLAVIAQAIFSEQLLARWLRLEWLHVRCNGLYKRLFDLFQSPPAKSTLHARVMEAIAFYETSKMNAAIMLSSRIFTRRNPDLSKEWDAIKATLGLK